MTRQFQFLFVFLGALLVAHSDVVDGGMFDLDPFLVESTRLQSDLLSVSQAVSVVPMESIQRSQPQITLDEAMAGIPGVFILNPYNYAQDTRIAIRGFGARADFGIRGIRLIIDGIPATTPDGQGEVDGMDLGSASRIEVLRGPSAAFYGASSGGVIRIVTESGPEQPFMESRLTAGDYGLVNWQFKAGGQEGALNYLISGGHLVYDGYRENSETENTKINGKLRYQVSTNQYVELVFNVIDFPLQDDPGGLTRQQAMENPRQARDRNLQYDGGESVRQERIGISYGVAFDSTRSLEVRLFHTHRDFENRLPFKNGGQVSLDRTFQGSRIAYKHDGGRTRFITGIDFDDQDDERQRYDNLNGNRGPLALDQNEQVRSVGLFVVNETELWDDVLLSAALRYDDVDFDVVDALLENGDDSGEISFSELSPSVGLNWRLNDNNAVYTTVSKSFETPTTTEFDNPEGDGFNTDLDAQQAMNVEVGTRGTLMFDHVPVEYNMALFHMDIEDALVPFELEQFPGREFYRNAGESTRRGFEAQARARLGGGFSIGFDYTFSDFNYDDFVTGGSDYSGNRLPGIPRHFGSIQLQYESASGFFATWQTRIVGSFYANDANSQRISSYTYSDLSIGYRLESGNWIIEPFLRVSNVLDESYFANVRLNAFGGRHYEPAPDRQVFGGIRVRYLFQ
ncbi:MAG: TonB-dependent receptor family protein [Puniceicoccaceae bacterium]